MHDFAYTILFEPVGDFFFHQSCLDTSNGVQDTTFKLTGSYGREGYLRGAYQKISPAVQGIYHGLCREKNQYFRYSPGSRGCE